MKPIAYVMGIAALVLGLAAAAAAGEDHQMGGRKGKAIQGLSREALVKLALSAAPPKIAEGAGVRAPGADGKLVELKKSTNGFTCYPDLSGLEIPDPICNDPAADQWFNDLLSGAPKPMNTTPGISYMARGGWRFEKDGKEVMQDGPGVRRIPEPPHWMVFWSFDSNTSGIPATVNGFGTRIMFEGTPYSHLMVYQNPVWITKK